LPSTPIRRDRHQHQRQQDESQALQPGLQPHGEIRPPVSEPHAGRHRKSEQRPSRTGTGTWNPGVRPISGEDRRQHGGGAREVTVDVGDAADWTGRHQQQARGDTGWRRERRHERQSEGWQQDPRRQVESHGEEQDHRDDGNGDPAAASMEATYDRGGDSFMTARFRHSLPSPVRAAVAAAAIAGLVLPQLAVNVIAQAPAAAKAPATATPTIDGGWPKEFTTASGAQLVLYQPQISSWEEQKHLVAYSAVSYMPKGADKATIGTVRVESDTSVSLDERLVHLAELKVTEANFGQADRDQTRTITSEISATIPDGERVIGLDRVLAGIDKSQIIPKNDDGVKADPPPIFFSAKPAVLINFDGDPIWSPIKDNDLKYAVNTNWDLFTLGTTSEVYLRDGNFWLKAPKVEGPWAPAGKLPESFSKLPNDENWKDVRGSLPGKSPKASNVPRVFTSTKPAELILLRGAPSYLLVDGTKDLLWVENTDADVFRIGRTGPVYFLVSGRWFSAPDFTGPWTFATPTLPAEFKQIPLEHPRSRVLASVPGTTQAAEAVLLASVPQTARVNRKEVKPPDVKYQGDPKFEQIPSTSVSRAVNTDKDVLLVDNRYFLCYEGVWFASAAPAGPWAVTSEVPKDIYAIPASSPSHNVTYVTVVQNESNNDWVTFAAYAGYTGLMVAWGCAVWGTGWYYPPYVWYGGFYPVYYPFYASYGAAAWYNPWTGTYGRSAVAYGPYGGIGATARYNPYTGTYARGAMAWGPYGARGAASAYNPRTGTYAHTRQGSGVYGSWGSSYVQRGDDWARTGRVTNNVTGNTTRVTRTDNGGAISRRGPNGGGFVAGNGDNVYAGHDGNVYRRGDDGGWQKWDNGNWGSVNRPEPRDRTAGGSTIQQLDRDRSARMEGARRTNDFGGYRAGGWGGSYRGGGARFGGRRR
jgi:hypothetical protein